MNFVHIVGRLAKDAEVRFTSGGQKVTVLNVASNSYRAGNEETIWWRVTLWGDRWDKMMPHLTKGKLIMIGGEMKKPEMYKDKNGQQQIGSLEVTADYIKFVPIGRPDQAGEGQQNRQHEPSSDAGYGYATSQQYAPTGGQQYAPTVMRSGSAVDHDGGDEEPLPF